MRTYKLLLWYIYYFLSTISKNAESQFEICSLSLIEKN